MTSSNHSVAVSPYGLRFLELFVQSIPCVPKHIQERKSKNDSNGVKSRTNRKVHFIETDLEKYLKGVEFRPAGWPILHVNKRNGKTGKIDYQFTEDSTSDGTLATCELKGPTREKLLEHPENNWFWPITEDVAKQFYRCQQTDALAHAEHYVAVLSYGSKSRTMEPFKENCLRPLEIIFPTARIRVISDETTTKDETKMEEKPLSIFVLQVGLKPTDTAC